MNKLLFSIIIVLISLTNDCFPQNKNLSKQQMKDDIAFLANAIKDIDPNLPIRQYVTGTNLYKELDSLTNLSDNITSFDDFYFLANKLLQITQDQHHHLVDDYPWGIDEKNSYITAENIEFSKNMFQQYEDYLPCCGGIISVVYIDGAYFSVENIYKKQILPDSLLIPAGSKILSINNIPIQDYINDFRKNDNTIRWSPSNNSYYTRYIHHPFFLTGIFDAYVTFSFNNDTKTINFKNPIVTGFDTQGDFSVQYFEKNKILYIRIPSMNHEKIDFLTTEIHKYKSAEISKVIIDIRYNGGGSDEVWQSVLSFIIKNPIKFQSQLYFKNTSIARNYITNIREREIKKVFKINDIEYFATETDEFNTINTSENSLDYNGKIYVLVNEKIFSSSLGFVSVCKQVKNLVTVGTPTGYLCGRSTTPFFLSLPNSKLIFELVPCIDMSGNKTKPEDYYDFQAEIPVNLTIDDYVFEMEYKGKRYGKEFLYNHDPVFKKVLEIEK